MQDVDLARLPRLAAAELRLLWVNDWYDGPLEAVVEHGGERCLMLLHGGGAVDLEQPMHWVIFRLSEAARVEEERWHALFEEHVGHHWCFHHEPPPDEPAEPRDPAPFHEAYQHRAPRTLGEAIGWVDEMPTR
jgi:hypothetical protein